MSVANKSGVKEVGGENDCGLWMFNNFVKSGE